jgi:hypothetical protein
MARRSSLLEFSISQIVVLDLEAAVWPPHLHVLSFRLGSKSSGAPGSNLRCCLIRWKLSGRPRRTLRQPPGAPLMPKCFQDAERLIGAWNERQAGRICCSRRRSVPLSRLGITSSGSIARPAALRRDIDLRALDRGACWARRSPKSERLLPPMLAGERYRSCASDRQNPPTRAPKGYAGRSRPLGCSFASG